MKQREMEITSLQIQTLLKYIVAGLNKSPHLRESLCGYTVPLDKQLFDEAEFSVSQNLLTAVLPIGDLQIVLKSSVPDD